MASARTAFSIKVDVTELNTLSDSLKTLTPEAVSVLMVDSINVVTDRTYDLARKTMLRGINLSDGYLQQKMQVVHATPAQPEASIVALGDRPHLTGLSHYGAMVETAAARRAHGNPKTGIPPGQKSAGVSVEVIKGKREQFPHGFFLPGKADSEGNPLVFARKKGSGKIVSRRGPAVYMLFRVAADSIEEQVYGDLSQSVINEAQRLFQKELA
jgi:hypothetical protein